MSLAHLVAAIDAALVAEAAVIAAGAIDLSPEAVVIFGTTIGVAEETVGEDVKPRLPQSIVLHRERYATADAADLTAYDRTLRGFQAEQAMPPADWTDLACHRIGAPQRSRGAPCWARRLARSASA